MHDKLFLKFMKFSYGSWVGLVLGLLTTIIVTRFLAPDALGKASMYDLFIQVTLVLTIFGTDQAFVRFFYEEEKAKRGALLYNSLRIPMLATFVLVCFIILFYKQITFFLFGKTSLLLAFFILIGMVAQLFFQYGQLVIRMQQKGNVYSLLQILQKVVYLILIILFTLFIGSKFEVLIFTSTGTILLVTVVAILFGKELWKISNINIKNVKHSQIDLLKYGTPFVLTIFISWLLEAFGKIALRQWSTFDELGLYSAAMRLVALVMVLRSTFSTFWTPVSYEKFEKDPEDRDFFRYITIVVSFVMFLVSIGSIAVKDLIVLLLGTEYQMAASIMPALVFMPVFYTISETTVIGINFYKKINWHILIAGISCLVNILGNWLLVPKFGAMGASVSIAVSFVVFFTLRTLISLKYYKVKYPLGRIYIMLVIVSFYAYISVGIENLIINLLLSIIPIMILIFLFYKDLIFIIKNKKS